MINIIPRITTVEFVALQPDIKIISWNNQDIAVNQEEEKNKCLRGLSLRSKGYFRVILATDTLPLIILSI